MDSHVKGIFCYPGGEIEKLNVEIDKNNMEEIKDAVKTVQTDCNSILTKKIEADKLKEPAQKKQRQD